MTLGGILILLLLLVSLIVFIYVIVVTAKSWGILHTLLLCTLFIECWVFIAFAAGVQYRRVRSTKLADEQQIRADKAMLETERLLYADFALDDLNNTAVVPTKGKLRRLTSDRGRVWRNLNFLQANGTGFQLELPMGDLNADADAGLADDAAVAAAAPSSESLPVQQVVYAFAEELNEENQPIPSFYLGEYTVTTSDQGVVTLEPTLELRKAQVDFIQSGAAGAWTLYELLPIDSHDAFAAEQSQATDEEIFGHMDEESLNTLLAKIPQDRMDRVVKSYLRDGSAAEDTDPKEAVWVQVNMLKDYEVDVDSQADANADVGGYFDQTGRAVDSRLKRDDGEGKVVLKPDMRSNRIVLKEEAARPLIDNGQAELVQRIYVRPLNDYEEAFNRLHVRIHEVGESIRIYKRETAQMEAANQLGQEMIIFQQNESQKLAQDLQGYQQEMRVLEQAVAETEAELIQLKRKMSQMYQNIQGRAKLTSN